MIRPVYTLVAVALLTVLFLAIIIGSWESPGEPLTASSMQNAGLLELTGTGARLAGEDHIQTAVVYSQTIYAHAQDKDRPGAVILVRDDDMASAIATTRLQHFPVNAPLLYLTDEGQAIPEATREELERLKPEGVMMDNNVQVYIAGNISDDIAQQVEALGLKVRQIYGPDPVAYNEALDARRSMSTWRFLSPTTAMSSSWALWWRLSTHSRPLTGIPIWVTGLPS